MADGNDNGNAGLPPKLDLRKSGVLQDAPKPAPVKPLPSAAKPVATQPMESRPAAVKPVYDKPVAVKPAMAKPLPTQPAAMKPVAVQPAAVQPIAAKPAAVTPAAEPVVVKPAAAQPLSVKPVTTAGVPEVSPKKETSKIPLETAKPTPGAPGPASGEAKTVKIKPTASSTVKVVKPAAIAEPAGFTAPIVDEKRKTSRISLESALGTPGGEGEPTAKTIKVKNEGDSPRITAAIDVEPGKTSRLDEAMADMDGSASPTQRKTIKVKRPTRRPGIGGAPTVKKDISATEDLGEAPAGPAKKKLAVAGKSAAAPAAVPAAGAAPVIQPVAAGQKMNPFFPIFSCVTMLVFFVLIYVLCAQAFGPNISLTELSYGAPTMDLPWPGKLSIVE